MNTSISRRGWLWSALVTLVLLGAVLAVASFLQAQVAQNAPAAKPTATPTTTPTATLTASFTPTPASTPTPYPSDYPAAKQTLEVAEAQTLAAALKMPSPEGTVWTLFRSTPTFLPEQLTPQGTPAGSGVITEHVGKPREAMRVLILNDLAWYESLGDTYIIVYSGVDEKDKSQGMIVLIHEGINIPGEENLYKTPSKAGPVQIVGAQGERLILLSDTGVTFYFDVPGRTFVASLTEAVITVTPVPYTPPPTDTPTFNDDAPNDPESISHNSPTNVNLRYYINPSGDVDWFRFNLPVTGTVQVHLESLPANYDLCVYSASYGEVRGCSNQPGKAAEKVTLVNAPPDDYYVEVWGVDGAWDANNSYQLRFNVPGTGGP